MFTWITNKIQRSVSKSIEKDIDYFIASVKGMPRSERALLLYMAQLNRAGMCREGIISPLPFQGVYGEKMSQALFTLASIHKSYVKAGSPQSAGIALLKLSLLSICHLNLRYKGQQMWSLFVSCNETDFSEAESVNQLFHPTNIITISYEDFRYVPEPLRSEE